MTTWKKIDDKKIRHVWRCPECGKTAIIGPDFYGDNGTPVCMECSDDMEYCRTETLQAAIVRRPLRAKNAY
ncbi:MAG: hypothetical protein COZ70_02510 [Deltaproteobacteria bacterium CG_4_8_14_3_um_filter_51_11]|nr:hypothetical protein [bacterium]OIP38466.1 MAG: hypothetical protein AUK25_12650 [Desulfobacteraceae bacterium CG2_30_51_40]PIP45034.1 MAG: hypothetical protein COX16_15295 [Deltaproteobacteria bacterium CG23_combo_of_CG06-09_8_20_14_all_51_20]PIX20647.1 MAG: hypothetical protein COZ70_02510 [Deltaproteobacteria bacterium CG_4_8_14_3_um_filter_51_11]PIY22030.1 MAG: hypothetical protein COZ11_14195 [Deltaproteobacteria bacterium CG_4_10_14_3_um_filter_51_14]PJB37330.1 MAG: hypothetical prote